MKSCLDGWTLDVDDVPFAVHAVRIVRQEEKMQKVLGIGGVFLVHRPIPG